MTPTGALRAALAIAAGAALVAGLSGGLARLGFVPAIGTAADHHGAFMICGFFGSLIGLERAVADGRGRALLVPAFGALGSVLLATDLPGSAAASFLISGLGLLGLTARAARRLPTLFTGVMTLGAALWPIGTACWLSGWSLPETSYVWLSFLVLTIAAERIELARLARPGVAAKSALLIMLTVLVTALGLRQPWQGSAVLAASLAGLATWLACNDIALRTVMARGLARYSAVCLLTGYGWLMAVAVLLVVLPPSEAPLGHDAAVHAIGLGFVLSMVFAHAPIILPAVVGARVRYVPALYLPFAVLQAAVAARVTGDAAEAVGVAATSAWLTVASLGLYAGILASTGLGSAAPGPVPPLCPGATSVRSGSARTVPDGPG